MGLTINTNIESMNAQRNLGQSRLDLARSMQRLSSGLRINSAKDDAAGLAITDRMTSQIRGINQAVRNANDGISLAQTAEGAMQEVTNILQRMREIAVQASNDTYSQSDRESLQGEIDQLYEEIDRIAASTQFNGINLLDGSGGSRSFQIGSNAGQTVSLQLTSVKTTSLNLNGYSGLGELNSGRINAPSGGSMAINGVDVGTGVGVATAATADTAKAAAVAINLLTSQTGVSADAYNVYTGVGNVSGITNGALTIQVGAITSTISASGTMEELVSNINRDAAGVTATLGSNGAITLSNDTGEDIVVGGTTTNTGLTAATYHGYVSLTDDNNEAISVTKSSTGTVADLQDFGFNTSAGSSSVTGGEITANALAAGDLTINGVDVGKVTGTSAGDKAAAINAISDQTGVTAIATTEVTVTVDFSAHPASAGAIKINGTEVDLTSATVQDLDTVITQINTAVQGVVASAGDDGKLVLTAASGLDIEIEDTTSFIGGNSTTYGTIALASESGTDIVIDGEHTSYAGFTAQGGNSTAVGAGLSVETVANANNAIERIDDAINQVASNRGVMGAVQNRMESSISNLQNVAENLSAARSRILDADIAAETSAMTKNNILQQAGVSILAQANQAPQLALQLLQG